ncbi:MAG: succinate dehydrogenase, hydrophobic membrane anchor protein [Pseudomonadota bacterium]
MSIKTPMNRVLGLGSAKSGTEHWWAQRISSVALVPLTILFLFPFLSALGGGYEAVRAAYASPFNALVAILFIAVNFLHLQQGLQVVIEDYVHEKRSRTVMMFCNTLLCGLLGAAGVFAIAKLSFGA